MFKTIAYVSTLATLALASLTPAHAWVSVNGSGENGSGENGIVRNGLGENGTASDRLVFTVDGIDLPAAR